MPSEIDLDAYFKRIGYDGHAAANLNTLRKLQRLHTQNIPFENLNPLLGIPVKLDAASLQQKLIYDNRGGYCFEHNLLFREVLQSLGFRVKMLGGRVLWGRSADAITQRTHMLLLVTIDGKDYITDVGFGGNVYTVPLLLKTDVVQETPLEPYRLMRPEKDYYLLEEQIHDEWKVLYRFTLQKQFLIDYKVANWYTSTHPDSHFVNDLIAARTDKGCRYIVHNNKLVIHHLNKESEHQPLANADEIREALEDVIGLKPPEADNLTPTLESFCTPAATG